MTSFPCGRVQRRTFLADLGMGFTGLALGAMLHRDGIAAASGADDERRPHVVPRAKSVIWYFMLGGTSHLESFDPKPALTEFAGKTIDESPHRAAVYDSPFYRQNVRDFAGVPRNLMPTIYAPQIGFQKRGESGIDVSDWWPQVGGCIDDIAVIRSMWTTDNDHAAQLQFHTGRHIFDGFHPSIGSWVHYGLGSLNDNLPQFVVMGPSPGDCCGGIGAHDGSYLGPSHSGVPLTLDPAMQARIKSYELAFRMQLSVPEVVRLDEETQATQQLYGLNDNATQTVGRQSLVARRLVERGVRFVQIFDDGWDAHSQLQQNHSTRCKAVDKPIAGLLTDLKQRGLLDETIVVWATEFGRTPGSESATGRDHHPYGFTVWMAGGGIQGGVVHGATDELGFHAVENRHYVTDVHATVLHLLGLDSHRLEIPGHKRLEIDFGQPIREIIA